MLNSDRIVLFETRVVTTADNVARSPDAGACLYLVDLAARLFRKPDAEIAHAVMGRVMSPLDRRSFVGGRPRKVVYLRQIYLGMGEGTETAKITCQDDIVKFLLTYRSYLSFHQPPASIIYACETYFVASLNAYIGWLRYSSVHLYD